jgi:hypothetical protein
MFRSVWIAISAAFFLVWTGALGGYLATTGLIIYFEFSLDFGTSASAPAPPTFAI